MKKNYGQKTKVSQTSPSEAASFLSKALKAIESKEKQNEDLVGVTPSLNASLSEASLQLSQMKHSRQGSRQSKRKYITGRDSVASYISHKTMSKDPRPPMKLITEEMVQRQSMKSDFSQILELDLTNQQITELEHRNQVLTKMASTLRILDLSFNKLETTEYIDVLTNLRELDLSFNNLTVIDNVPKLPNLRSLNLDFNKITKINNIRGLRKLETLSIQGNLISDFSCLDIIDPMIELKDLNLSQNKISAIESIKNMPNLDQLNISENPISLIFPDAFGQISDLKSLTLDKISIKNPEQDLEFLKKLETSLIMLSMNYSFPRYNLQSIQKLAFLKMNTCLNLHLKGVGLEYLHNIDYIFPKLQVLDLTENKILTVESIEILKCLPEIAEVNFLENPVCVHENVKEMILEVVPSLEVINELPLKEAGAKYKQDKERILRALQNAHYKKGEEPTEGDDLLLQDRIEKGELDGQDDEGVIDSSGKVDFTKVLQKQREYNAVFKKAQEEKAKQTAAFNDLERNIGLRLVTLNEVDSSEHELKSNPMKDVQVFHEVSRKTFGDLRQKHRDIVGNIRTREHDTISKLGSYKPPESSTYGDSVHAYDKISAQVERMKEKIIQSKQAQEDYSRDSLSVAMDKRAMTFRDFYSAKPFDSDSSSGSDASGSEDEEDQEAQMFDAASNLKKGKKQLYDSQVKKAKAERLQMSKTGMSDFNKSEISTTTPLNLRRQQDSARQSKDFIIKGRGTPTSSRRSKGGQEGSSQYHLQKNERKLINKGNIHSLKGQNEVIQRMIDRSGKSVISQKNEKDTLSISSINQESFVGGTPKIVRTVRRNSQSRVIEKEMALPDEEVLQRKLGPAYQQQKSKLHQSVISQLPPTGTGLGNRNLKQDSKASLLRKSRGGSVAGSVAEPSEMASNAPKSPSKKRNSSEDSNGSVSSTEIDFTKHVPVYKQFDVYGKRVLHVEDDPVLQRSKMQRKKKEEPEYKQNFLAMFLEEAEQKIQQDEQQKAMRDKLAKLKRDQGSGQKPGIPKSILKKPQGMDPTAITMPQHKSKAFRPPIQVEDGGDEPQSPLTEEQEARLTSQQITEGVDRAREAVNAPSADLLDFERQLKARHDEYKAKGIVPKLQTASTTIKPKRLLRPKNMNKH